MEFDYLELEEQLKKEIQEYVNQFANTEKNNNIFCFQIVYHPEYLYLSLVFFQHDDIYKGIDPTDTSSSPLLDYKHIKSDYIKSLEANYSEYLLHESENSYEEDVLRLELSLINIINILNFSGIDKHNDFFFMISDMTGDSNMWQKTLPFNLLKKYWPDVAMLSNPNIDISDHSYSTTEKQFSITRVILYKWIGFEIKAQNNFLKLERNNLFFKIRNKQKTIKYSKIDEIDLKKIDNIEFLIISINQFIHYALKFKDENEMYEVIEKLSLKVKTTGNIRKYLNIKNWIK